jgi:hypothetical protein
MIKFLKTPVSRVNGKDLYPHDVLLVLLVFIVLPIAVVVALFLASYNVAAGLAVLDGFLFAAYRFWLNNMEG